jgi:2,4-dienoyl-CoA reductase-like NADH-dependent reductase (Old Yellow Enzyme family)
MGQDVAGPLSQPLTLPSGTELKNRLIKAAMSDSLGDGKGNGTYAQARLYERWAEGGTALSLIGEAQVSASHPEKPGNLVLTPEADLNALAHLAKRGSANGAQIWPQLGHAGALSYAAISTPKGPSALDINGLRCDALSLAETQALPTAYAQAAQIAQQTGFGGVMIHAGHGFLLSQFLSPLFNHRSDAYGGSISNRFRLIAEIIDAVSAAVGQAFPIAIKINSTDSQEGGLTNNDALKVVRLINQTAIDLIDISGGTYFPGAKSSSDGQAKSGPYFIEFAKQAKQVTTIPIMLTGGISKRDQAVHVIKSGAADAVGLARAMVLDPALPQKWLNGEDVNPTFPRFEAPPAGGITAWYTMRLTALGNDSEASFQHDPTSALASYDARDQDRSIGWRARFP